MSHTTTSSTQNLHAVSNILSKLELKETDFLACVKRIAHLAEKTIVGDDGVIDAEEIVLLTDLKHLLEQITTQFGNSLSQEHLLQSDISYRVTAIRIYFEQACTKQSDSNPTWERIDKLIEAMEILTRAKEGATGDIFLGAFGRVLLETNSFPDDDNDDYEELLIEGGH